MSAFYDLASLVVVPSGYKASKVYAQKPLTTDGQLAFARSTTATRVNSAGLIEASAINVPRLDYLNSTCPKLLLEPSRTNLATSSEDLTGVGWSFQGTTVSSNATTAPDGLTTADAIVETATTDEHNRIASASLTAASHTASIFLKKFNQTWCALYLYDGTVGIRHWINLDTLTAGATAPVGAGITAPLTLTNYGNGWVRASMTWTATATTWAFYTACVRSNGGVTNYAGDGTSGVYAWGAQVEAGAYATSYVKTTSAAVTRGADAASKTGISSLIGQTEGTLFAEMSFDEILSGSSSYVQINSGTFTNAVIVGREPASPNGAFVFYIFASGVTILNNTANSINTNVVKMALAYKSGDWAAYLNGSLVASGSTTFTFNASLTQYGIGSNTAGFAGTNSTMKASQALLFKTRLTNAQLAELTTI